MSFKCPFLQENTCKALEKYKEDVSMQLSIAMSELNRLDLRIKRLEKIKKIKNVQESWKHAVEEELV